MSKVLPYIYTACVVAVLAWVMGEVWFGLWNKVIAQMFTLPHYDMIHMQRVVLFIASVRAVMDGAKMKGLIR